MLLTTQQQAELARQFDSGGSWVLRNNISDKNIESCYGEAEPDLVTRTCDLCVAANKTAYAANNLWQPTHPNCKCESSNAGITAQVDFDMRKITKYLFKNTNKSKMMHKIGYRIEDSQELHNTLTAVIYKQYELGNYTLGALDKHGQHVQVNTLILGKRDHVGELHKCHIGCVLWPYGKIKVATPLVVDDI